MRCCGCPICQYLLIGSFGQIMDRSIVEHIALLVKMRNEKWRGAFVVIYSMFDIIKQVSIQQCWATIKRSFITMESSEILMHARTGSEAPHGWIVLPLVRSKAA